MFNLIHSPNPRGKFSGIRENFSHFLRALESPGFTLNCLRKSVGWSASGLLLEVIHCERSNYLVGPSLESVSHFPKLYLSFFSKAVCNGWKGVHCKKELARHLLGVNGDFK